MSDQELDLEALEELTNPAEVQVASGTLKDLADDNFLQTDTLWLHAIYFVPDHRQTVRERLRIQVRINKFS